MRSSSLAAWGTFAESKKRLRRVKVAAPSEVELDLERNQIVGTIGRSDDQERTTVKSLDRQLDDAVTPNSVRPCDLDLLEQTAEVPFQGRRQLGTRTHDLGADLIC